VTPDEVRQLADRLDLMIQWAKPTGEARDDLTAAAVALRHHANLTDAIGDPADLLDMAVLIEDEFLNAGMARHLQRIADAAAAVSPPPAPTSCPTCGDGMPPLHGCPDSWHQAAT
jgi:hypothetical protein